MQGQASVLDRLLLAGLGCKLRVQSRIESGNLPQSPNVKTQARQLRICACKRFPRMPAALHSGPNRDRHSSALSRPVRDENDVTIREGQEV